MRIALLLMCLHPAATRQMGKPRAVLFDFDGSLAQSEEAHRKRFVAATGVACDSARWDAECDAEADAGGASARCGTLDDGGAEKSRAERDADGAGEPARVADPHAGRG